jgi:hypothetical protein
MDRGDFIKTVGLGGLGLTIPSCISNLFDEKDIDYSKDANIKLAIGTEFNEDVSIIKEFFYSNNSMLLQAFLKSIELFKNMGSEYGLGGINIEIVDPEEIYMHNNIIMQHNTTSNSVRGILQRKKNLIEVLYGNKRAEKFKKSGEYETKKRERIDEIYESDTGNTITSGRYLPQTRNTFLYIDSESMELLNDHTLRHNFTTKIEERRHQLINYLSRIISHEWGHCLSLDHVKDNEKNKNNIMNSGTGRYSPLLDYKFNEEQVKQMLKYVATEFENKQILEPTIPYTSDKGIYLITPDKSYLIHNANSIYKGKIFHTMLQEIP